MKSLLFFWLVRLHILRRHQSLLVSLVSQGLLEVLGARLAQRTMSHGGCSFSAISELLYRDSVRRKPVGVNIRPFEKVRSKHFVPDTPNKVSAVI